MGRYTVYNGKFNCHTCKVVVTSMRHYPTTKELTWMCNDKHISIVSLETKKSKRDYEREIRE